MNTNKIIALMPDLAVFVTVVEQGNFTLASKKLGLTPSAVSKKITRLETLLSTKLFERSTRQLVITDSGHDIYHNAQAMLTAADNAINASNSSRTLAVGKLTISTPKAYGKQILEPLLYSFLKQYPDIQLSVKVTDRFIDPIQDEVDIAFRLTDNPTPSLVSKKIGTVKLVLCASKMYLEQHGIPQHPNDLKEHSCLYLGEQLQDNHWKFVKEDEEVTVAVEGRYAVNHSAMRLNGIKQHLGIGLLPDFTVVNDLAAGAVIQILPTWDIKESYNGIITMQFPHSKYLPKTSRVFIDYIANALKPDPTT